MAGLFRGLGKAGTGIFGGVVEGTGKLVESVGEVAGGSGIIGEVVKGPGKVVETVGKATEEFGEKVFGDDDGKGYGDNVDDEKLIKQFDNELERQAKGGDGAAAEDDDMDEAEKKLMRPETKEGADLEDSEDEKDAEDAKVIPKHFSLKSKRNKRYLRYINEDENSDGLLRFSGKNVVGPYSKFAIRASKTDKNLVHIRCSYNNKYWVRLSEDSNYIAAIANEEEEEKSKWSCTLFEPIFVPEQNGHYFRHVQLNMFLCLAESDPAPYNDCLASRVEDLTTIDEDLVLSVAVDWDSIFILPKYVAFKSNNDRYLEPSGKYLKFSASSVEDQAAAFEVISMDDGYVRMKHVQSGKYWIRDPNWIHCESINTEKDNPNTLFWPIKVDNNFVAFRNKGNNRFCKRLTTEGKTNCLNAAVATITDTARLEVTEIIVARSIDNVEYRLKDARIYGKKILSVSKGIATNETKVEDKITLKFRYQKMVERIWTSSVSTTIGLKTKFTSSIPTVGKMSFELSAEISSGKQWEETEKEKSFEETVQTVTVPAESKVRFSGMITQASCDVPFSYTRRDTLKDGSQVTHHFEDGLFSGVSTFDFKFETEQLPL